MTDVQTATTESGLMVPATPSVRLPKPAFNRGATRRPNLWRFYAWREMDDRRLLFKNMRFSDRAAQTPLGFEAGIATGPGHHRPLNSTGEGFNLLGGGKIILAKAKNDKTVDPIVWRHESWPEGEYRNYVGNASFEPVDGALSAIPYQEDDKVCIEFYTGIPDLSADLVDPAAILQAEAKARLMAQSGLLIHGACHYIGGTLKIDAIDDDSVQIERSPASSSAAVHLEELEDMGMLIGGIPKWHVRTYEFDYSRQQSENVLVFQVPGKQRPKMAWKIWCDGGRPDFEEVDYDLYFPIFRQNYYGSLQRAA